MTIPDYETLMLPVIRLFASGSKNVSECLPTIKREFGITDQEAEELLPTGRVTLLQRRTQLAIRKPLPVRSGGTPTSVRQLA
jgi:restriction system protein